jgi:hypothetical protein
MAARFRARAESVDANENGPCEKCVRNYVRIDFSCEVMRIVDEHIKKQGAAPRGTAPCMVSAADHIRRYGEILHDFLTAWADLV